MIFNSVKFYSWYCKIFRGLTFFWTHCICISCSLGINVRTVYLCMCMNAWNRKLLLGCKFSLEPSREFPWKCIETRPIEYARQVSWCWPSSLGVLDLTGFMSSQERWLTISKFQVFLLAMLWKMNVAECSFHCWVAHGLLNDSEFSSLKNWTLQCNYQKSIQKKIKKWIYIARLQ